jgi:conjugal transfer mating pair stabilization protein TraG
MSCERHGAYIADKLADPTLFDAYSDQICARTGFDVTQTTSAIGAAQIDALGGMMLDQSMSRQKFLTNVFLGQTVGDVLFEDSPAAPRVMANRAIESNGLATLSTANEWMPTIRASVFAIMLMMMPIALLFILTPINLRVASFAFGLFVFVALWGVIDAGIYQLTLGRAMGVLAELRATKVRDRYLDSGAFGSDEGAGHLRLVPHRRGRSCRSLCVHGVPLSAAMCSPPSLQVRSGFKVRGMAAATVGTSEGYANALEAQGSATGTMARRSAASSFGDFGERSSFGLDRAFASSGSVLGEHGGGAPGTAASGLGRADAARVGGLALPLPAVI